MWGPWELVGGGGENTKMLVCVAVCIEPSSIQETLIEKGHPFETWQVALRAVPGFARGKWEGHNALKGRNTFGPDFSN